MLLRCSAHVLVLISILLALGLPALAQQAQGDKEVSVNGFIDVPNSDPSSTLGNVTLKLGDYIKPNTEIGIDSSTLIQKSNQEEFIDGFYRHYLHSHNEKLFPFFGGSAGYDATHDGATSGNFLAKGELGIRYYLSQRFAFDVAYNLQYVRTAGQSFTQNSDSVVVFGFSFLFGGHKH